MTTTPLTRHCCIGFGIERGVYEQQAFYVDAEARVGPRAVLLDDLLTDTYRREADSLLADIEALGGAMMEGDARRGTRNAAFLAGRLDAIAAALVRLQPAVELVEQDGNVSGEFTFDGPNGGRPIPPAPVIDAREESDSGSDDDGMLVTFDVADDEPVGSVAEDNGT